MAVLLPWQRTIVFFFFLFQGKHGNNSEIILIFMP